MKVIYIACGSTLMAAGVLTFWLPIPIGVPLFLIGASIYLKYSPDSRAKVLALSAKFPRVHVYVKRWLSKKNKST